MDDILTNTKAWVSGVAGVVLLGCAVHEWLYRYHHPHASGPAGVMAVAFGAAAVVAFAVLFIARDLSIHRATVGEHSMTPTEKYLAERYPPP